MTAVRLKVFSHAEHFLQLYWEVPANIPNSQLTAQTEECLFLLSEMSVSLIKMLRRWLQLQIFPAALRWQNLYTYAFFYT